VPLAQSEEFYKRLKDNNVDAEFVVVTGGEHNFASLETLTMVLKFFDQKLRS